MKSPWTVPLAILFGGLIVAIAVYTSTAKNIPISTGNPALVRPVDSSDHIFGNPDAPVKIVEYSDFDCTYCAGFDDTLHQIIADEGANGEVAWVYREFPLTELHSNAMQDAEAAECAASVAGNDAFWNFKTELFANQPIDPTQYGVYAQAAGITSPAFATCVASASTTIVARINADRANALAVGATGTPYSLILVDGQAPVVIPGAYPYDAVKQLVDQALAEVNQ